MKTDLITPCKECPFRRTSMRGYLGPWGGAELLIIIGNTDFACHMTIPKGGCKSEDEEYDLQVCAGAALFMNHKHQLGRTIDTKALQDKLRDSEERINVFTDSDKFRRHHWRAFKELP